MKILTTILIFAAVCFTKLNAQQLPISGQPFNLPAPAVAVPYAQWLLDNGTDAVSTVNFLGLPPAANIAQLGTDVTFNSMFVKQQDAGHQAGFNSAGSLFGGFGGYLGGTYYQPNLTTPLFNANTGVWNGIANAATLLAANASITNATVTGTFSGNGGGLTNLNAVTNGQSNVGFNEFFNVMNLKYNLSYTSTNPFDAIGNVYYSQWNGRYTYNGSYYTNSSNTNLLFFYGPVYGWEFSTNYPDSSGSFAFLANVNAQNQFPTNSANMGKWFYPNFAGTPSPIPDTIDLGQITSTFYATNIAVIPYSPTVIGGGSQSAYQDDGGNYVIQFYDTTLNTNFINLNTQLTGATKNQWQSIIEMNGSGSGQYSLWSSFYVMNPSKVRSYITHYYYDPATDGISYEELNRTGGVLYDTHSRDRYGHNEFGIFVDGQTNTSLALLTAAGGSTNSGASYIPAFQVLGQPLLPTIMTNGAFNTFNGKVFVDEDGTRGAILIGSNSPFNGGSLTNLNGSAVASGTVADARLSALAQSLISLGVTNAYYTNTAVVIATSDHKLSIGTNSFGGGGAASYITNLTVNTLTNFTPVIGTLYTNNSSTFQLVDSLNVIYGEAAVAGMSTYQLRVTGIGGFTNGANQVTALGGFSGSVTNYIGAFVVTNGGNWGVFDISTGVGNSVTFSGPCQVTGLGSSSVLTGVNANLAALALNNGGAVTNLQSTNGVVDITAVTATTTNVTVPVFSFAVATYVMTNTTCLVNFSSTLATGTYFQGVLWVSNSCTTATNFTINAPQAGYYGLSQRTATNLVSVPVGTQFPLSYSGIIGKWTNWFN